MKKFLLSCMVALGISASAQISVNEGFEGTSTPTGWTYSRFSRTTAAGYPCAGTAAIRVNLYGASTATTSTANAVYSSLNSNGNAIDVSFKYSARGFSGTAPVATGNFRAEYSVDGGTTYNLLGSQVDITTSSAFCLPAFTATIPAGSVPTGANFKFRILGNNSGSGDWYLTIDEVVLNQIATCYAPTGLTNSAVTANSATVSWTASTTPPGNGYDVYYSTSSTAPTSATTPSYTGVTGLSQDITGLTQNTTYYAWVRSVCSGTDQSAWSNNSTTFKTSCGTTDIPYSQNFETSVGTAIPSCTSAQNAGTGNNWAVYSFTSPTFGFSSGKVLRYSYNATNAANAWFYTQGLNLTGGTTYVLKFRAGSSDFGYNEKLKVAFGSSALNTAMTNVIADYTELVHASSNLQTVYFTPATSGTYYIGFNAYSDADQAFLMMDDISIDVAPVCAAPADVTFSSITENSVVVNWSSSPSAPSNYDVYYSTSSAEPTAATTPTYSNVSGNSQAISDLTAGTNYYVWVRSACSGTDKSEWSNVRYFASLCPSGNYNVPYTQNFDSSILPSLPNCVTSQNLSNGLDWATYKDAAANIPGVWAVCSYSSTAASNAWLYTAGINLEAGKQYKITYKYTAGGGYTDKLKVAYGKSATSTGMTNPLADYPSISSSAVKTAEHVITITESAVYYFGFNAYSPADQYFVAIDDISVVENVVLATNDNQNKAVTIYPNPFKDTLHISETKGLKSVEVIDVSGRVSKKFGAVSTLDLSSLTSGLYLINLKYEDGSMKTMKAVKK